MSIIQYKVDKRSGVEGECHECGTYVAELVRVTEPGGRVKLLCAGCYEDLKEEIEQSLTG